MLNCNDTKLQKLFVIILNLKQSVSKRANTENILKNTFTKQERLKSKCYFDTIFSKGKSTKAYPIRAIYLGFTSENFDSCNFISNKTQVAFAVTKRKFKKATDRNRIKRQMREAYRLNKSLLNKNMAIVFVYLPYEKSSYESIEKAMKKILENLNNEV